MNLPRFSHGSGALFKLKFDIKNMTDEVIIYGVFDQGSFKTKFIKKTKIEKIRS